MLQDEAGSESEKDVVTGREFVVGFLMLPFTMDASLRILQIFGA